ncbi:hypothetical protein WBJ53_07105 [Spirosoma sp. SC4-14]|uniref:hypothetical protein n=1 Tax=Spirosoma sp. SC4-14 TaxID=3128900 RepID=UPI0030D12DCC
MATVALWKNPVFRSLAMGCLTLGLAPFFPEPHIIGKFRWVLGGATGMKLIDWGDLALHGFPWVGLLVYSIWYVTRPNTTQKTGR